MHLEYCCYNKNPIEDVRTEITNVFDAIGLGFSGVALPLYILRQISHELSDIPLTISCPIDYPLGCGDRKVRQHESLVAVKSGATAIDLVMSPYLLSKGVLETIKKDVSPILGMCEAYKATLRVILNYDLCETKEEAFEGVKMLREIGAEIIIPSSGFRNDDIFDNILFCRLIEKELGATAICSGRMWLEKHYKSVINSGISGLRVYSLKNSNCLGVSN